MTTGCLLSTNMLNTYWINHSLWHWPETVQNWLRKWNWNTVVSKMKPETQHEERIWIRVIIQGVKKVWISLNIIIHIPEILAQTGPNTYENIWNRMLNTETAGAKPLKWTSNCDFQSSSVLLHRQLHQQSDNILKTGDKWKTKQTDTVSIQSWALVFYGLSSYTQCW